MTLNRRDALKNLLTFGAALAVDSTLGAVVKRGKGTGAESKSQPRTEGENAIRVEDPRTDPPPTSTTEEMYRQEFADTYGDPGEHGFAYHCVNCQGNCAWQVWTKNGKVTRENQSASYPQISSKIPDFNPRGCNKGAQHSQVMYEEDRLLYPMKRMGERGEGKWKRISWDEAATEVAQRLYTTMLEKGPAGNSIHIGAGVLTEARAASVKRMGTLLGAVRPYIASYVGDMFPGVSVVYGEGNIGCTYDFVFTTDVSVFWGCNPNTSRIPDAHFVWEGKYQGSKIIVIAPEFNSTAIHADLWVPIKPGYDGHLALAIIHEMLRKKLYKPEFLRTFTDLPFLVRTDTKELVRLADIDLQQPGFDQSSRDAFAVPRGKKELKESEIFLSWNSKNGKATAMPGSEGSPVETLRLQDISWDIVPELEGSWKLRLKNGKQITVTTAFEVFKTELQAYSPESMQALTGVHPEVVSELAVDLAKARNALITMGFAVGKYFNGMLSQRAIASLAAFSGRLGPLGGLSTENEWNISGLQGLSGFDGRYQHRFASGFVSEFVLGNQMDDYEKLYSDEDIKGGTGHSKSDYRNKVESLLAQSEGDQGYQRGKSYWNAVETFLLFADARFRRNKGGYRDAFLKKAKFIAYGDYRMSDFAMFADVLLPCKSHYEVWDIRTNPGYHRYANISAPPERLKPVGESKSEWEICTLIIEKLQQLALKEHEATGSDRAIRIPDVTHSKSGVRRLDELVKEYTLDGRLRTDKGAVEYALEHVEQFRPNTIETMKKRGGFLVLNDKAGKTSPLYRDKPYNTHESTLFLHAPLETLTGRLTFYVDHPLWVEAGANVPISPPPIRPKRMPFILMTPHARWSIHSTYKTSPTLLRLQRGKPYVMINPEVAKGKGISDGDDVRMFNDLGDCTLMAKLAPGVPKDAVVMEHGWEPFMYRKKKGHNALVGDMINLLELTDGWGHLKFGTNWDGNQHAYETTLDFVKA